MVIPSQPFHTVEGETEALRGEVTYFLGLIWGQKQCFLLGVLRGRGFMERAETESVGVYLRPGVDSVLSSGEKSPVHL